AYDRGREIGKRAVELAPKSHDAHLWYAINTARWGETKGVLRSLFLLPTIREELGILLELDPRSVRAHILAGNVLLEVPGLAVVADRDRDPFRVLIACILSLRTQDTTTGPASDRLFAVAATPTDMLKLPPRRIERLIYPVGFYRTKAHVILGICRDLLERFEGRVPDTIDELLTLNGVGRKTANLVVTMGFGKPG